MRLGQNLWHQSVLIKVLNIEDLPLHLMILLRNRIDVSQKILILEEEPPELFVVI